MWGKERVKLCSFLVGKVLLFWGVNGELQELVKQNALELLVARDDVETGLSQSEMSCRAGGRQAVCC